ncbi:MAG TPA: AraC family transcriptional regulator [Chitinispirillaceae bacterium]|nr:AraC family transcriptional regulator [Chitinispirillaceae bacterium]
MHEIKRYPVQNALLRNYIRFFWELRIEQASLDHVLVPQKNINLRINLADTDHYLHQGTDEHKLEKIYFSGLHDHFTNAHLKLEGKVSILGVCFYPDGFYPFINVPLSEFRNKVAGADEAGLELSHTIREQLNEAATKEQMLEILEKELLRLLVQNNASPEKIRQIINAVRVSGNLQMNQFCARNNIGLRKLERMFNKYVGVSASTYNTLNRFHGSMNLLLKGDYKRLSDVAYDNGYFDQMHFIKEFRRFAGNTPGSFISRNNSILQIGKF